MICKLVSFGQKKYDILHLMYNFKGKDKSISVGHERVSYSWCIGLDNFCRSSA